MTYEPWAGTMTRLQAAVHEVRCRECRVTWKSWAQRIFGIRAGMSPAARIDRDGA